jgi:hypothetical protein
MGGVRGGSTTAGGQREACQGGSSAFEPASSGPAACDASPFSFEAHTRVHLRAHPHARAHRLGPHPARRHAQGVHLVVTGRVHAVRAHAPHPHAAAAPLDSATCVPQPAAFPLRCAPLLWRRFAALCGPGDLNTSSGTLPCCCKTASHGRCRWTPPRLPPTARVFRAPLLPSPRYRALNVQAGTTFCDTAFEAEVASGRLSGGTLDKYACVALAGAACTRMRGAAAPYPSGTYGRCGSDDASPDRVANVGSRGLGLSSPVPPACAYICENICVVKGVHASTCWYTRPPLTAL